MPCGRMIASHVCPPPAPPYTTTAPKIIPTSPPTHHPPKKNLPPPFSNRHSPSHTHPLLSPTVFFRNHQNPSTTLSLYGHPPTPPHRQNQTILPQLALVPQHPSSLSFPPSFGNPPMLPRHTVQTRLLQPLPLPLPIPSPTAQGPHTTPTRPFLTLHHSYAPLAPPPPNPLPPPLPFYLWVHPTSLFRSAFPNTATILLCRSQLAISPTPSRATAPPPQALTALCSLSLNRHSSHTHSSLLSCDTSHFE